MWDLNLINKIRKESHNSNNEICGLILFSDNIYNIYPCKNISFDKKNNSIINPLDYIKAEMLGEIVGFYHSQENDKPSLIDYYSSFENNLFSIVYCKKNDKFYFIKPELEMYLNKDFKIGVNDCFQLIKNYYKIKKNIIINNYIRDDNWYKNNPSMIFDNFKKENFYEVDDDMREDDILLFGKNKQNIRHMGIYLNNNMFLHHSRDNKSSIELLDNKWKNLLKVVIRYKYE